MSNPGHYREQARRLMECAQGSPDGEVAQQLLRRAQDMLALAERQRGDKPPPESEPPAIYRPNKSRHVLGAADKRPI